MISNYKQLLRKSQCCDESKLDKIVALGSKSVDHVNDSLIPDFMIRAYNGLVGDIFCPPILNAVVLGFFPLGAGPRGVGGAFLAAGFFAALAAGFLAALVLGAGVLAFFAGMRTSKKHRKGTG